MAHLALAVEGSLISSDLVEQIAAMPQDVMGQRPTDFCFDGRLSDEIQTTFSDTFIHWNAFQARLARGKESATTITRETWVLPLLEELDFTLTYQRAAAVAGGVTFTISHRFGVEPDAPPVHIVSRDQDLDRKGNEARSPHALVQDYLNRSDALWGIVTNGLRLRLLRNTVRFSKPSFIEFDLEAIFKGNLYSEFVLFYRLVHATRLPRGSGDAHESWLERYYQQGLEQGGRVRERLRDGVEEALKILGTGFLAHPESNELREKLDRRTLSHLDYYRELLRLIYRLLFLMVAEERRLLFVPDHDNAARQEIYDRWYSIERLRRRALESRVFYDEHGDLWEGLKQTFTLFEDSRQASQLGLTALDGELFGRFACANLIDIERQAGPRIRNADLLTAIRHLSTFEDADGHKHKTGIRRRVNFGGLDVEEFGSVYESLLDYHPDVIIDGPRSRFDLIVGSERKATGSYYTPPELVRELIKSALEPVIEDRLAKAVTRDDKERALLSFKVCDPASGSGHFMLAAARRIGRELARVRSGEAEPNPADYRHAVRDVIRRCIYAVDKNPLAVDLCKVALWIEGHEPGLPLSFLDHHVKYGESLIGVFDLKLLEEGVPDEAYKAMTGDDKKVAGEIRKRNKEEAKGGSLFQRSVEQDIAQIAGAFSAIADLPETRPDEVQTKEAAYSALRHSADWEKAKWACDLWTAAFFASLTKDTVGGVPTTHDVWNSIGARLPQGRVAGTASDLATKQRFFHWPLEFPEVFAAGGFDVMLGNPPWERIKLSEQEFFSTRDRDIAEAPNKAARERLITALSSPNASAEKRALAREFQRAKHAAECEGKFVRESGRFPLTAFGDINTYAIFAETFLKIITPDGRAGLIVPTGIATDSSTKAFFDYIVSNGQLVSLFAMENEEFVFPAVHHSYRFCLLTLNGSKRHITEPQFVFFARQTDQIHDHRRRFTLSAEDIEIINPNTRTCAIFRSKADSELTKKICRRVPILIDERAETNHWGADFGTMFHMSADSGHFRTYRQLASDDNVIKQMSWHSSGSSIWVPLYEAKMIHHYDHRWGTFDTDGDEARDVTDNEKSDPSYRPMPRYWIADTGVTKWLRTKHWTRGWLLGWRDIASAHNLRTLICAIFPLSGVSNKLPIVLFHEELSSEHIACFVANLSSLVLDYVVRQKIGGTTLNFFYVKQFPVLEPKSYKQSDISFIAPRVLELIYTAKDMRPFAQDLAYEGPPFKWDPERRTLLRAELDAYYAYLYGLTKRELEYILDPKAVMGEDYPSETFRVLKEDEESDPLIREYRTRRLVLEAWDRLVANGIFDAARLREPQYIDRVAAELSSTRGKLEETERNYLALMNRAQETPKPTLFVEGITDTSIIRAAWSMFFPKESMPFEILDAGGTKQMGSLAGKGKALRALLGDRVVFALADNDSEGRALIDDGHIRKGGVWRQLPNGIHWCLLKPTADFAAVMKAHNIPTTNWPFTIEEAFPPALRRQAQKDGAWRFAGTPQAELLANPDVAKRLFVLQSKLNPVDDAYWYLMSPAPEAKEAFAAWVTDPKRRTEDNYAAFEEVIRGLRDLVGRSQAIHQVRGAA